MGQRRTAGCKTYPVMADMGILAVGVAVSTVWERKIWFKRNWGRWRARPLKIGCHDFGHCKHAKIKKAVWRRVNPHGLAEEETSLGLCMEQTYSATDLRAALQTNRSAPCTDYSLFPAAGLGSQRLSGSPKLYACFALLWSNRKQGCFLSGSPACPGGPTFAGRCCTGVNFAG